jgi:hypothetical protein
MQINVYRNWNLEIQIYRVEVRQFPVKIQIIMTCDNCLREDPAGRHHCGDCSEAQAEALEDVYNRLGIKAGEVEIIPSPNLKRGFIFRRGSNTPLKSFPD